MYWQPSLPYLLMLYSFIVILTFEYIINKKEISILMSDKKSACVYMHKSWDKNIHFNAKIYTKTKV